MGGGDSLRILGAGGNAIGAGSTCNVCGIDLRYNRGNLQCLSSRDDTVLLPLGDFDRRLLRYVTHEEVE